MRICIMKNEGKLTVLKFGLRDLKSWVEILNSEIDSGSGQHLRSQSGD